MGARIASSNWPPNRRLSAVSSTMNRRARALGALLLLLLLLAVLRLRSANVAAPPPREVPSPPSGRESDGVWDADRRAGFGGGAASHYTGSYHDFGVLVVNYHKTGHVLARSLTYRAVEMEYQARGFSRTRIRETKNNSGVDALTGEKVAFRRLLDPFPIRSHNKQTHCPDYFNVSGGTMYIQEAPDLYCDESHLAGLMLAAPGAAPITASGGGLKVVHLVRNPYDMALSNYFYHAQIPSPEEWVHVDEPCVHEYGDGGSLSSHVLPVLSPEAGVTQEQFDSVVDLCNSLHRSNASTYNSTFYEHLLKLDEWDGLRLATAQMIVSSARANQGRAGGDILRMANNIVRFKRLQSSQGAPRQLRERLRLLTMSMDEYIREPFNSTMRFFGFLFDERGGSVSEDRMARAARKDVTKQSSHVTSGKNGSRIELRMRLRRDPVIGAILNETEALVNEALLLSNSLDR